MDQVKRVFKLFPKAKFDSATTKTIELLPKDVKKDIFEMVVSLGKIDIMEKYLKNTEPKTFFQEPDPND